MYMKGMLDTLLKIKDESNFHMDCMKIYFYPLSLINFIFI